MSKPATIAQSGTVRLPVIRSDRDAYANARAPRMGHDFAIGDQLAVMAWERRSYDIVRVTYYRRGENVNVRDVNTGERRSMDESELMFLAGQAHAHFGATPETPGVGIIVPSGGIAHNIVGTRCLTCH